MSTFPITPGYSNDGTSKEAARAASLWSNSLRVRVLLTLIVAPGTADEVASRLKSDYRNVQPRISELKALGLVESAGFCRPNALGNPALVWRVVRAKLPPEFTGLGQGTLFA